MDTQAQNFFRNKNVVVLGAGYIGGHLAKECLRYGARVTVLTRNPDTAAKLEGFGAKSVCADLATDSWHEAIGGDIQFCLNSVGSGGSYIDSYRRSYVSGMESVAHWLRKPQVSNFTYTSSTSIYCRGDGGRIDESEPIQVPIDDEPSRILLEAEGHVLGFQDKVERWFILRLAGIYGPERHQIMDRMKRGETQFGGTAEKHINLVHQDDVIRAIMKGWGAAFGSAPSGIFNVVDDGEATRGELITWLARRLKLPTPVFTGVQDPKARRFLADRIISNSRIKSVLGWNPVFPSFREGYESILGDS